MSRKSRETIGPSVDIPAMTESNARQNSSDSAMYSDSDDVMGKVIEFYIRDLFPKKLKPLPCDDQRGKAIEFPKDGPSEAGKTRRAQRTPRISNKRW